MACMAASLAPPCPALPSCPAFPTTHVPQASCTSQLRARSGAHTYARCRCSRAQALLCAYVDKQPEGSLSAEQLTQLAHAVRLAHLTPYFLAKVAPRVGWLCAEGREEAVEGVAYGRMGGPARTGTPAAWLPGAPARAGKVDPESRPVEWELPLAQLQPLVDRVAAGGSMEILRSPSTTAAFGLG
jgi:hypothetical protein